MPSDVTIAQAVRAWFPRWEKSTGDDFAALRALSRVTDSFRFDYGYSYNEIRAAFGRALDREVSVNAFESMMQDLDEEVWCAGDHD